LNEAVQLAIERTKQNIAEGRLPSPDVPTQGLEIAELWRRELYPHLGQEIFNELFADTSEKGWNDIRAEVAAVKKITAHLTAELQRLRDGLNELAAEVKHNSTVRDEYQDWERTYELLAALTHPPSDQERLPTTAELSGIWKTCPECGVYLPCQAHPSDQGEQP
jgi:hypothetical protein